MEANVGLKIAHRMHAKSIPKEYVGKLMSVFCMHKAPYTLKNASWVCVFQEAERGEID